MSGVLILLAATAALAQTEPPEAMQLARRAYESVRAGRSQEAIADLRRAAGIAPSNALYRSALGGVLEREGQIEPAIEAFSEAARLAPGNTTILFKLGGLRAHAGQWEAAREPLVQILSVEPAHAGAEALLETVSLELGAVLARSKRFRAGQLLAQDTAKRYPRSAPVHVMLGLFESRNQRNIDAVSAYRRAVELAPDSEDGHTGFAIALSAAGMAKEARAAFEAAAAKFPSSGAVRQAFGVFLAQLHETGEESAEAAATMLRSALALDPRLAEAHYQLGVLALSEGGAARAAEHLNAALAGGLDDARVHYAAARALRRLGKTAEADQHLRAFQERKQAGEAGP